MKNATAVIAAATAAGAVVFGAASMAGQAAPASPNRASTPDATFQMVRSTAAAAAHCLPHAKAVVRITKIEGAERMTIQASGLRPNSEYDLFVLQNPDAPFGLSWYQGDMESNQWGRASGTFIGRFNEETFTVAPGSVPAPVVHDSPIADADTNPATAPVHQYHLGLWFNSPTDAAAAGCGNAVTPFNGEHNAGVQVLSTRQFPALNGPLHRVAG
jgi:hypothetical protein